MSKAARLLSALAACGGWGCAEWGLKPTFPVDAAEHPVIFEQALLGLDERGSAAAVQLVDAEGVEPRLDLLLFDRAGRPTRTERAAPPAVAREVARRVRAAGATPKALLGPVAAELWPDAPGVAARLGFSARRPSPAGHGQRTWAVRGAEQSGSLPFLIHAETVDDPSPAIALFLCEAPKQECAGDETELLRMPLAGRALDPEVWIQGGAVWMLTGSVDASRRDALRRAVGLRNALLSRGEAEIHNAHGLAHIAAGELDAARRELDRAVAADGRFVDGLYNAAVAAALSDREDDAVRWLRRAVEVDALRVQVLGRHDADLASLRRRPDVRALLGLKRLPPEGVPPPP